MAKKATSTKNKKVVSKRKVERGMAMIQASFNNTIVTLTDEEGNALIQGSPAVVGFGGARRSTAFAATKAAQDTAQKAIKKFGLKEVKVFVKGPGSGRNAAVKGLDAAGLRITHLADRTPIPHNGCMPRKAPRN
ncbi:MAG: 30S ribosomal protein S11 [Candidatus Dojkabacteria bacterium]|nr:30S ribosomal protein S11 [Candidatus Dojkabacteria bacterium]